MPLPSSLARSLTGLPARASPSKAAIRPAVSSARAGAARTRCVTRSVTSATVARVMFSPLPLEAAATAHAGALRDHVLVRVPARGTQVVRHVDLARVAVPVDDEELRARCHVALVVEPAA